MKPNKWPDFLFTITVRFICGAVIGAIACVLIGYRLILRLFSRDHTHVPVIIVIACALIGGIIAACTVPRWQTPWYKGYRHYRDDDLL